MFNDDAEELSTTYTVDGAGGITFPFVGRVSVDGLTLREIQAEITRQLEDGFLVSPQVSIEIEAYRSQSVFVIGEVARPGIYELRGNLSLIEALADAGGITAQAGNEITISRRVAGHTGTEPLLPEAGDDPAFEVTPYALADLQSGRLALVTLRDGDTVNVAKAPTFYVTGQVTSDGSYVWAEGMTVLEAIALAGGYTARGSNRGLKIDRMIDGERVSLSVNEDDLVQAGDLIQIRTRRF